MRGRRRLGGVIDEMSGRPVVVAVVLNWHDSVRTSRCVYPLDHDPRISEVLVVDNESDGTLKRELAADGLDRGRIIEVPENRGFAGGVNVALRRIDVSKVDAVLVVNNDAVVGRDTVRLLVERMKLEPCAGAVAPVILNPDGSLQALGSRISRVTGMVRENLRHRRVDYISWACVLLRAEVLTEVGFLDDRFFMYWEDVDYSRRLRAAGYSLAVEDRAVVIHALSASRTLAGERLREYSVWSLLQYGEKHGGIARFRSRVALLWTLAARLLRLDRDGLHAIIRGASRARGMSPAWHALQQQSASPRSED